MKLREAMDKLERLSQTRALYNTVINMLEQYLPSDIEDEHATRAIGALGAMHVEDEAVEEVIGEVKALREKVEKEMAALEGSNVTKPKATKKKAK